MLGDVAVWETRDARRCRADPPARRRRTAARAARRAGRQRGRRRRRAGDDRSTPGAGSRCESGIVTIEAATVDRFVPQMVNFELVGGVDFQKGCYPGQEVVARSQYRGTTKRRTFLFDCDVAADRRAGRVRARRRRRSPQAPSPTPRRTRAARAAARSSRCASPRSARRAAPGQRRDGPLLRRAPLPYPVPLDAERRLARRSRRAVRELFVWYRVRAAPRRRRARRGRRDAAVRSRRAGPGLQARLLIRDDGRARRPGWKPMRCRRGSAAASRGIDAGHRGRRSPPLRTLVARCIEGARHVEAFAAAALSASATRQSTRSISTWAMPASSNSGPRRTKPARS